MGVKGLLQRLKNTGISRSVRLENGRLTYLDAAVSKKYKDILLKLSGTTSDVTDGESVLEIPPPGDVGDSMDDQQPSTLPATTTQRIYDHQHQPKLRIGVDASMWIASVCYGMSEMLVDERYLTAYSRAIMEQEQLTVEDHRAKLEEEYVFKCSNSVVEMILNLRDKCGVPSNHILVVFDGGTPPAKQRTCDSRRKRREDATVIQNGDQHDPALRIRASKMAGAPAHLQSKIKSTILNELRCHAIPFMVAPYESDSQLMYLCKMGYIDLVLSADSDLIAMCAPALLCQFDMDTQQGQLIRRRDLMSSVGVERFDLQNFTDTMVTLMCIAAGCDYCENLPRVGIARAYKVIREAFDHYDASARNTDDEQHQLNSTLILRRIFDALYQTSSSSGLSEEDKNSYEKTFTEAICMYLHPIVFDPVNEECVFARQPVTHPDKNLILSSPYYSELCHDQTTEQMQKIVGKLHSPELAKKIASGCYDPKKKSNVSA